MSHYTVAVLTRKEQNIDELLEPFDENIKVEPYIDVEKEDAEKIIKEFLEKNPQYKKEYIDMTWAEQVMEYYGQEIDQNGNPLSTYNPNSKWDWYNIGGRWNGLLKTKDGKFCNSCLLKDLDLTLNEEQYNKEIRFWEIVVEEQPLKDGEEEPFNWYKKEYYLEKYGTKENYAKLQSQFGTYAILTPEGEWLEPGQMGWWGISGASIDEEKSWEENYMELLNSFDKDLKITIVDCHI